MDGLTRRTVTCALLSLSIAMGAGHFSAALTDDTRLAIKGYDPVAYFEQGKPSLGLAEIEYVWDEHRYRFSRPEHRELFKANPARFVPQFTNYCAMALARGIVKDANPEYWLISEGRLFLFSMAAGSSNFQESLAENHGKASLKHAEIPKR